MVDVGIEIIGGIFLANEGASFYIFSRGVKPFAILLYKTTGLKMNRLMVGVIRSCHLISACQYLAVSESKSMQQSITTSIYKRHYNLKEVARR